MKKQLQVPPGFDETLLSTEIARHCVDRMRKRGVTPLALLTTLQFGTRAYKLGAGCSARVLFDKNIPHEIPRNVAEKIVGTVIIVSGEGRLITTYRNPSLRPIDLRRRYKHRHWN